MIEAPILSSIDNKKNITLIWNDIKGAEYYNIYRDGILIKAENGNSFIDKVKRGQKYCYQVSCVDQYQIESDKSNQYCKKLFLEPPTGLVADADVNSINLSWDPEEDVSYV